MTARSPKELWRDLAAQERIRLGELAVARGWCSASQVEGALAIQPKAQAQIGQILLQRGALTTERLAALLLEQADLTGAPLRRIGRYVALHEIGRGGMGVVWKAWDPQLARAVAIKLLHAREDPEERQRFMREARIVAKLAHPSIVPVHEVFEHGGQPCIVMGLIDGRPLRPGDADVTLRRAMEIVRDAARTVQFAHDQGVVHRDLKPENLMVDGSGRVWVLDFGLAKTQRANSSLTVDGMAMGTPAYMPPEQARGRPEAVGPHSDVYALGATLYALAAGRAPFHGTTPADIMCRVVSEEPPPPRRLRPEVHRDVETIIVRAMEKEPARRYASAGALADDIDRFLRGEGIVARPVGTAVRLLRAVRRNPLLASSMAALVLVVAVGVPLALALRRRAAAAESDLDRRARASILFEEGKRHYDDARVLLYQRGRDFEPVFTFVTKALPPLRDASRTDPTYAEPEHYIARCHMLTDTLDKAETHLDEALRRNPGHIEASFDRGLCVLIGWAMSEPAVQDPTRPRPQMAPERRLRAEADFMRYASSRGAPEVAAFARAAAAFLRGDLDYALRTLGDKYDIRIADEAEFLQGLIHMGRGSPELAVVPFKSMVDRRPLYFSAYHLLGAVFVRLGDLASAVDVYERWARLYPWEGGPEAQLAGLLTQMGDYARADELFEKARPRIIATANSVNFLCDRAYLRLQTGRAALAAEDYREALRRDPGSFEAADGLAQALILMADVPGAEAACAELDRRTPDQWRTILARARLELLRGDPERAFEAFERAASASPTGYEALFGHARALLERRQFAKAEAQFAAAVRKAPARWQAYTALAELYRSLTIFDRALEAAERAAKVAPLEPHVALTLARALGDAGRHTDAVAAARRAVERAPASGDARRVLAHVLRQSGDLKGALEAAEQALRLEPDHYGRLVRSDVYAKLERWEDAEADLAEAVRLEPQYHDAWERLAFARVQLRKPKEAAEAYARCTQLAPDLALPWLHLGVVLGQLKRHAEAVAALERARDLMPKDPRPHAQMGSAYWGLAKPRQALASWEEALRLDPSLETPLRPWIEKARASLK